MNEKETGQSRIRNKCAGALLGTFAGDAVGAPVEDTPTEMLADLLDEFHALHFADPRRENYVRTIGLLSGAPLPPGSAFYTDDTQMMIGAAESLIAFPDFDPADMASRFAENHDGHRGYGPGATRILTALRNGSGWDQAAGPAGSFEHGSFGNGAAMRVAPIGVRFADDPVRLREASEISASITHTHPLGKEGAVLQANAVAAAFRLDPNHPFDTDAFLTELQAVLVDTTGIYAKKLMEIDDLLHSHASRFEVAELLGNDATAPDSVPAAIYSFLTNPYSFRESVVYAVCLGGDTDTIGAMAGAISGAFLGVDGIPAEWLAALENGAKGRDYVLRLAEEMAKTE